MSPELRLDNHEDNFEQGKLDKFTVVTENVGWLNEIRVYHDNYRGRRDKGPGWYLNTVRVKDLESKIKWEIPVNRWFAKTNGDGLIDRTIKVPVGSVTLTRGGLRQTYIGYEASPHSNKGSTQPQQINAVFSQKYKRSTIINWESSWSAGGSIKLSGEFFGVSAELGAQISYQVKETNGISEEEQLDWTVTWNYALAPGEEITVVSLWSAVSTTGTAEVGSVGVDWEQLHHYVASICSFPGILNEEQVENEVRKLIKGASGGNIPETEPLKMTNITIKEQSLKEINPSQPDLTPSNIAEALERFSVELPDVRLRNQQTVGESMANQMVRPTPRITKRER